MAVEALGTNPAVTGAIRNASRATGTDFQYLVATAQVESGLNPRAAAPTSSARGLFQFIEQTWLATLKEKGPALGYGQLADAIVRKPSGRYAVSDPRLTGRIMNLRNDPAVNALMAGAYTQANAGKLTERLGRSPTEGELYVAHFLGSNGAGRLISLAESRPGMRAADAFPGPARANRSIFYDRKGRPHSVAEVYRVLVNRYAAARGHEPAPSATPAIQVAAAVPLPQTRPQVAATPVQALPPNGTELAPTYTVATNAEPRPAMRTDQAPARPAAADQSIFFDRNGRQRTVPEIYRALVDRYYSDPHGSQSAPSAPSSATKLAAVPTPQARPQVASAPTPAFAPDGAELARTYAEAAELSAPPRQIAEAAPVFHGLFRSGPGNEPVAPVVSALWITPLPTAEAPQPEPQQVAAGPAAQDGTLSLFQDRPANVGALFRGRG